MNKDAMLQAIKGSGGIVNTIATRLGCDWHTAKKYINEWEETKQAYADETEIILDTAESAIFTSIQQGEVQSAKWLLATKGKQRGYSERHEIENTGNITILIDEQDAGL